MASCCFCVCVCVEWGGGGGGGALYNKTVKQEGQH